MTGLTDSERAVLNDSSLIEEREKWFGILSDLYAGKEDPWLDKYVFRLAGTVPRPADEQMQYTDPERWVIECLKLVAAQQYDHPNRFSPCCVEYPIYGVHFIDRMFGANVYKYAEQWNADFLTTPIGSLKMPDLDTDETWNMAKRAAKAFLDADVKLPLFGLPTLSSALNIIINLYGADALMAMVDEDEKDAVRHDLAVINELIMTLHKWYLDNIPLEQLQPVISWGRTQPHGFGQLCGCSTQLLSGELYAELIAPLDDALLGVYPNGGMIHLCGSHLQHVETFRSMPHLRALQLNDAAAGDLEGYYNGLRDDQILYLNPYSGMTEQKAIEITGGNRLVVVDWGNATERNTHSH